MDKTNKPNETIQIPFKEKLKSIPEVFGIRLNEEPAYELLKKDGDFELRRYPKQLRAKVTVAESDFDLFRETAFEKLAAFIFGGNHAKTDISMTAPVLLEHAIQHGPHEGEPAKGWTMSFIMPSKFHFRSLPKPNDPSVKIEEAPPAEVAVMKYSGINTLQAVLQHQPELERWIASQPGLKKKGDIIIAQYDGPFVLPFMRRNELQFEVQHSH